MVSDLGLDLKGGARTSMSARPNASAARCPAPSPGARRTLTPSEAPAGRASAATRSSLVQSAAIVGVAFVASRILCMVREIIVAARFGTSGEYGAYLAAFRIPDLLFLVVMAGSFGSAFIPVFAGQLARNQDERAWRLASAVINLATVAILISAAVVFVLAEPIVRDLVAPGLSPALQQLAAQTMRILLLSPVLLGLGIAAKGILEAQDRFLLPALAPLVYNLGIIIGALVLAPFWGVYGLAAGVVAGALGHMGIQVPGLLRSGMRYTRHLTVRVEGLAEVGRLLLPRVIGQAAFQVNFIVVTYFASQVGDDRIAALNYAWQLMMLPHGVLALSISTVIFPSMARLFEEGRMTDIQGTFARALRPLLFLTLPAAVALFAFRTAVVQTLFQYGAFSAESTALVADPLAFLALGLVFYALVEVLTRAFYAMHDSRTPVIAGLIIIGINVTLSWALVGPLGHAGLALSLAVTTAIEACILTVALTRRLGGIGAGFGYWLTRVLAATAVMTATAAIISQPLAEATAPGAAPRLVQFALFTLGLGITATAFTITAAIAELEEVNQFASRGMGIIRRLVRAAMGMAGRR